MGMSFSGSSNAEEVKLPSPKKEGKVSLEEALDKRHSIRQYASGSLALDEVSQVLWAAYGKNKWGKLTSPSAGALYPLTIYLIAADVDGLNTGFYRYNNRKHSLDLISKDDLRKDLSSAALNQPYVREAPAVIIICADYGITASGYGKRAERYVDIEVGHVGQNIYLEATALGLGTVAVGAFSDRDVKKVLGVGEEPLYIMPLGRAR
jgi:SagB-type dehydrogenase family enzyme